MRPGEYCKSKILMKILREWGAHSGRPLQDEYVSEHAGLSIHAQGQSNNVICVRNPDQHFSLPEQYLEIILTP